MGFSRTVLVFWSPRGGVGTTTLAVNSAAALSRRHRVALLDFNVVDPTAHCHFVGSLPGDADQVFPGIARRLRGSEEKSGHRLLESLPRCGEGLWVLPGLLDSPLGLRQATEDSIRELLVQVSSAVDYTVVDTASFLSLATTIIPLTVADRVICPLTQDLSSIYHLQRLDAVLRRLGLGAKDFLYILNRHRSGGIRAETMAQLLGHPILLSLDDDESVQQAANRGRVWALTSPARSRQWSSQVLDPILKQGAIGPGNQFVAERGGSDGLYRPGR